MQHEELISKDWTAGMLCVLMDNRNFAGFIAPYTTVQLRLQLIDASILDAQIQCIQAWNDGANHPIRDLLAAMRGLM